MDSSNEYLLFIKIWNTLKEQIEEDSICQHALGKSIPESEKLRNEGNNSFVTLKFKEADHFYRKALLLAPHKSAVYKRILANLSAVKFMQQKYVDCINLIRLSMNPPYPPKNFPKLYLREIKAWMKLGEVIEAEHTLEEFYEFMHFIGMDQVERDRYHVDVNTAILSIKVDPDYEPFIEEKYIIPQIMPNPEFHNASVNVMIMASEKYGRHVVAKTDIRKGDVILVDTPYAVYGVNHCPHCMKEIRYPVPCKNCSYCMYCSETCRCDNINIHKWECIFLQYNESEVLSPNVLLAFRILLKGMQNGYDTDALRNDMTFSDPINNFLSIERLFSNFKISPENDSKIAGTAIDCASMAAFYYYNSCFFEWLNEQNIFGGKNIDNLFCTFATKLLKLSFITMYNMYATHDEQLEGSYFLYPSYSMFNHSCVPNTSKYMSGTQLVLKASHDIQMGEQIFTSYGTVRFLASAEERKNFLMKNFEFHCDCEKCSRATIDENLQEVIKCQRCSTFASIKGRALICSTCNNFWPVSNQLAETLKQIYRKCSGHICGDAVDAWNIIQLAKEIVLNPRHELLTPCRFTLCIYELNLDNLPEAFNNTTYLPPLDESNSVFYRKIFDALETFSKKLYLLGSYYMQTYTKRVLSNVCQFLEEYEMYVNLYCPSDYVFHRIMILKRFYNVYQSITDFEKTIKWTRSEIDDTF